MDFVFVDLETTGAVAQNDHITEIAVLRMRQGQEVSRWSSLVNPQQSISSFIQRLTGISNNMVADAPTFAELAGSIREQLQDAIFVAHNARFDYGFLKNEFRRIGQSWQAKVLCTVKLSRRLYPEYRKHGLDQLIARHHLPCSARHRAMGDVEATAAFFRHCIDEHGQQHVDRMIEQLLQRPSLPVALPADVLDAIPAVPGIYRFYGDGYSVLYVGKSIDISQRIQSHFQSDYASSKELQLAQQVRHIDWQQTAGDLGAQLLELREIERLKPLHNRQHRGGIEQWFTLAITNDAQGYHRITVKQGIDLDQLDACFGLFSRRDQAMKALRGVVDANQLCLHRSGVSDGDGPCMNYQLHRCKGACIAEETPERYNLRTELALSSLKIHLWPWDGAIGIREHHAFTGLTQVHVFWRWCHLTSVEHEQEWFDMAEQWPELLASARFNKPVYQLLQRYLFGAKGQPDVHLLPISPMRTPADE